MIYQNSIFWSLSRAHLLFLGRYPPFFFSLKIKLISHQLPQMFSFHLQPIPGGHTVSSWMQKKCPGHPHAATCTSALEANDSFLVREPQPPLCWSCPPTGPSSYYTHGLVKSKWTYKLTRAFPVPLTAHYVAELLDLATRALKPICMSSLAHFPFWVVIHTSVP